MEGAIRILMLEDSAADAELTRLELQKGGIKFQLKRVDAEEDFARELKEFAPDIVLTDFSLPKYDGLSALALTRQAYPDLPAIFLSGTVGEDAAIATLTKGATDYVLKGKMSRLVPAVKRALEEAEERRQRRRAEQELRGSVRQWHSTFEAITDGIFLADREGRILLCNSAFSNLVQSQPAAGIIGCRCYERVHGTAGRIPGCPAARMFETGRRETLLWRRDGHWFITIVDPLRYGKRIGGYVHILVDVTERKKAEEKSRRLYAMQIAFGSINQMLLRVGSEPELFQQVCSLIKDMPDVKSAWIGLVQPGSRDVRTAAQAGPAEGFAALAKSRWGESESGQGLSDTAIRTGRPVIVDDRQTDPKIQAWRNEAARVGAASLVAVPLILDGSVEGVLIVESDKKCAFSDEDVRFLVEVAGDIVVGVKSLRGESRLQEIAQDLQRMMDGSVKAITSALEMRDPYTAGHQRRVAQLACAIGAEMGLPEDRIKGIRIAGYVHDIGKIAVPAEILAKPGRITDVEFSIIKTHPQHGYDILKEIDFTWPIALATLQHHERLDGTGYPQSLRGEQIILEARILAVADVIEAMSSHRPFRPALGTEKAIEEALRHRGVRYDPKVVDACVRLFREKSFKFDS